MFGHQVALNFNRQGDSFNTVIGGVVSVLLKCLMLAFLINKFLIMIYLRNNTLLTTESLTLFRNDFIMSEMGIVPYFYFQEG